MKSTHHAVDVRAANYVTRADTVNWPRRFGIGEWYGDSYAGLTSKERRAYAAGGGSYPCPFRLGGGKCTKKGGVCSFRLYEDADGVTVPVADTEAGLRVLCPRRFEEEMTIFQWVGEVVLGTSTPDIATEIGFLKTEEGNTHVGRIDMVLASQEGRCGGARLVCFRDSGSLLFRHGHE